MGTLNPLLGLILGQVFVCIYAAFVWQGDSTIWYVIGFFFVGGFRLSRAMAAAFTQSFVHIHSTGLAFGIMEAFNGLAMFLAPLVAGILFETNPESVYSISLILIAGSIAINIWLMPVLNKKNIASKLATELE
jgi:MFS family permease